MASDAWRPYFLPLIIGISGGEPGLSFSLPFLSPTNPRDFGLVKFKSGPTEIFSPTLLGLFFSTEKKKFQLKKETKLKKKIICSGTEDYCIIQDNKVLF